MKNFAFSNTVVYVSGVEITGWSDGDDVIGIEYNNPPATHKVGAGGDMVVSHSSDRSGKIKFKLQRTSSSNKYLLGLYELNRASSAKAPIFVTCADTARQDFAVGSSGYFSAAPKLNFGATAPDQEWEITVERLDLAFGLDD